MDRTSLDLVGLLKSWIPRRDSSAQVSRDFWMPDQSCRVCYECDSFFTLFNRRHHCRLCGRVFCAKCASNSVPLPPREPRSLQEECEKVRVCHFCFKQWQQGFNHAIQVSNLDSNTFLSAASFISSKSSGTGDSSSISITSVPHSSLLSPHQSAVMESSLVRQNSVGNSDPADTGVGDPSTNQFSFCTTRSYDEDDEYGVYQLDSQGKHYSQTNGYFSYVDYDDIDKDYGSHKVYPNGEATDEKSVSSLSSQNNFYPQASEEVQQIVKQDVSDECEASSSLYAAQDANLEPVDFESSGILWLPPEPEDEDDEREGLLFDDDDDGDAAGEWGYLHASSSFGSGEYRGRDRSNEEQKKVVKNVVDGHFRALVSQLMQVEKLVIGEEDDKESWLEIVTSLSWEAATLLKPDTSKGGGMDPGGYVKVKCIASGRRSDSAVVKGVVCKKNVAHRRMTSKIEKARILILEGALEYQRVSNHLSSFATLLQQEMDHLKMTVAKIDAHNPDVLLVEKSVSRYAQEYLLEKDISLVLNIKKPVLERIARCTGGQIVHSVDHLSSQKMGYCDMFHVEKFLEEHGTAGEIGKKLVKTLMYFEGCPKPLGCTILLHGANGDELKKVKRVVQYSIFAAYHLALETSFLADEGASLPELPLNSPITVALPDKPSTIDRSISTIPGFTIPACEKTQGPLSGSEPQRSMSAPPTDMVKAVSICAQKMGVSESSGLCGAKNTMSSFCNPSLDHESDKGIMDMMKYSGAKTSVADYVQDAQGYKFLSTSFGPSQEVDQAMLSQSVQNDCNTMDVNRSHLQRDGKDAPDELTSSKEEFPPSPSDNQSILVSLSSRCVWKGTVCERSHLFRIKYYGNFDKPLGRFLRDHLFDQSYRCRSCEMPSEAHVQCYTHRQGTLTISVKKLLEILLPGEKEGKIWMWHRCLKCPRDNKGFPPATRRVVMSDAAWGLSFGKFLELSFSNHAAASRVASCGHSLHRDCLRFYGFGKMVACFRYASIDVHSVYLPPSKLDFNYENQEWIQHEVNEVIFRAELLFVEVLNAIRLLVEKRSGRQLNSSVNVPEARRQISDLEGMLQKEKEEFEESLLRILTKEVKKGQSVDILEINRLRRQLLFQSYVWDHRLVYAASMDDKSHWINGDVTSLEPEKPLVCNDKSTDLDNCADPSKCPDSSESLSAILKDGENGEEGKSVGQNSHVDAVHQESVVGFVADCAIEKPPGLPVATKSFCGSYPEESILQGRRALSDGQFPNMESLSDTLEAAWTGETTSGVGVMKGGTCKSSEPFLVNMLTTGTAEKVYTEDHGGEEQSGTTVSQSPPLLASKGSENMEDFGSWLSMPFISFYQALNKNFLPSAQKLDPYNPVYISSFRESDAQNGARLLLPVGINDTVIPVYDDEPTSIISYALVSHDYHAQLSDELEKSKDATLDSNFSFQSLDSSNLQSPQSIDEMVLESYRSLGSMDESLLSLSVSRRSFDLDPLSYTKTLHARVSFGDDGSLGRVKYSVTCYYAKRFEALRRICCPSEMDFIRSLSRCKKWGAQGGKSNVFFAKTLDDRFIIKQVTKTELESFMKFAPAYFKYLSESIITGSPTCLAKILGIYQVSSKHLKGGKESKMDVLVMENLLFGRNLTRLYDLKGSARSRYNPDSSGSNKVLLDQNLIESMPTSPIFVGNKAKRLLERAVWNDTAFLALVDVMDYSLLVGVDEEKNELVLGIIDFMRQYTWDKHLETWVKASGILGGPKNASPTIISPKQYKKRFRKAMTTYFLMVPDTWSPPSIIPSKSQTNLCDENMQGG